MSTRSITSQSLRNTSIDLRGHQLRFDAVGKCTNVHEIPDEILVLIVPMPGFAVAGLEGEAAEAAQQHAANVAMQRQEDAAAQSGIIRGLPPEARTQAPPLIQTAIAGRVITPRHSAPPSTDKGEQLAKAEKPQDAPQDTQNPSKQDSPAVAANAPQSANEEASVEAEEESSEATSGEEESASKKAPIKLAGAAKKKTSKKSKKAKKS